MADAVGFEGRNGVNGDALPRRVPCLLLILRPRLTLAFTPNCPEYGFAVDGREFHDAGLGEASGFYDWLRGHDGGILGVDFMPFDACPPLIDTARDLHYACVESDGRWLQFYFGPDRGYDGHNSSDQAFCDNRVYCAGNGEWAISFGVGHLTPFELDSLRAADADWATVQSLHTLSAVVP